MMLGDGGEDSGLVSGGAPLVVFCLQVDDEDAREMVAPLRSWVPWRTRDSVLMRFMMARTGESLRCSGDGGWRRFRSLVVAVEALQIYVSGGDDEDANLACDIREVENKGGFAWRSWRLQ
ncbi:hypothetical protein LR48_Vigan511s011200 [Vigna angularis]|uniref:Uncharacterized protein n=1 Tax=Phaseolus angularis TaxID=3914 RepID=A0A0L9TDP8_PHAAN|nr:hypothetical protein LR48_Vigan511s011200 [Vigna angularis]